MNTPRFILRASAAALIVSALIPTAYSATVDDFDPLTPGDTPALGFQFGGTPGPVLMGDEYNPSFLRLLGGQSNTTNQYAYDMSDPGAYNNISISFDFRVKPGTNGYADGFSLMLVPTSVYGTVGDNSTSNFGGEEPNAAGVFGLGIDLFSGTNEVSLHWNGALATDFNTPLTSPFVDFRNNGNAGKFNKVQVNLQRVGNGTNAVFTMIGDSLGDTPTAPVKLLEIALPNMLPYENRVVLAGRTGGQNMYADIDNLNVSYSNPYVGGLSVAPSGHLYQDFQSVGTSNYVVVQAGKPAANMFRPGPLLKEADAKSDGEFLRLVNKGVDNQNNQIRFDRAMDAGASLMTEILSFDFRYDTTNPEDTPADGLGVLLLPTKAYVASGSGEPSNEEPNLAGAIGLGFDLYPNSRGGVTETTPSISLHYDNALKIDVPFNNPEIAKGEFHRVELIRTPVDGGLNVTVIVTPDISGTPGTPQTVIDNYFLAGARNYDYRVQFTARTGGSHADHDLDNIKSAQVTLPPQPHTQADFSTNVSSASGYKAYRFGAGLPAEVQGGIGNEYFRLVHDGQNSQVNSIVFDQQEDSSVLGAPGIDASFDFRLTSPDQGADGLSFMLIPTSVYGSTGPGVTGSLLAAEVPNAPGVFGLGIGVWQDRPKDRLSLHWDGQEVYAYVLDNLTEINLDNGVFHRINLQLNVSGSDVLATLVLTGDVGGAQNSITIFDNVVIPGMELYDYRVEFGARTGGSNMSVDLDNILVQTVPEPGSLALLGLGAVMLARRRRRA